MNIIHCCSIDGHERCRDEEMRMMQYEDERRRCFLSDSVRSSSSSLGNKGATFAGEAGGAPTSTQVCIIFGDFLLCCCFYFFDSIVVHPCILIIKMHD